jgi:hypothetical protein
MQRVSFAFILSVLIAAPALAAPQAASPVSTTSQQERPVVQRRAPVGKRSAGAQAFARTADRLVARSGDLEATLTAPTLRAGDTHRLTIAMRDVKTQQPMTNLEPYLGAWGHLFVVNEQRDEAAHAHPDSTDTTPGDPTLAFDILFPRAGTYHLWTQIQHRGAIVTFPFVVRVQSRA